MHTIWTPLICLLAFPVMGCSQDVRGPDQIRMPASVSLTEIIDVTVTGAGPDASLLWWWSIDEEAIHEGTVRSEDGTWTFSIESADSVFDEESAGVAPWTGVLLVQQQAGERYSGITRGEDVDVYSGSESADSDAGGSDAGSDEGSVSDGGSDSDEGSGIDGGSGSDDGSGSDGSSSSDEGSGSDSGSGSDEGSGDGGAEDPRYRCTFSVETSGGILDRDFCIDSTNVEHIARVPGCGDEPEVGSCRPAEYQAVCAFEDVPLRSVSELPEALSGLTEFVDTTVDLRMFTSDMDMLNEYTCESSGGVHADYQCDVGGEEPALAGTIACPADDCDEVAMRLRLYGEERDGGNYYFSYGGVPYSATCEFAGGVGWMKVVVATSSAEASFVSELESAIEGSCPGSADTPFLATSTSGFSKGYCAVPVNQMRVCMTREDDELCFESKTPRFGDWFEESLPPNTLVDMVNDGHPDEGFGCADYDVRLPGTDSVSTVTGRVSASSDGYNPGIRIGFDQNCGDPPVLPMPNYLVGIGFAEEEMASPGEASTVACQSGFEKWTAPISGERTCFATTVWVR